MRTPCYCPRRCKTRWWKLSRIAAPLRPIGLRLPIGAAQKSGMLPVSFLRTHGRLIAFGLFMYFCSSAGQTFFVSLFGGELRAAFVLSHGAFGTIYAAATSFAVASVAATLMQVGPTYPESGWENA